MTAVDDSTATGQKKPDLVSVTIDGIEISVPPGTLVIRAAEMIGTQIPRFCDHPLLDPVGACRQCLVEVEGQRKPLASCTTVVTDGMVVHTQRSSEVAEKAQRGVMELLLINHPLDCPVCDKGGECPLQNQAMSSGRGDSRFTGAKRTFTKPVPLSSEVLLDRERCVLCARCTRFSEQIAGDPLIGFGDRGALQQVTIYQDDPFESYFSGNTVQICPVGALTSTAYRFRARPFDLVSSPSVCEHCASGCAQRTDHRRGKVLRRLAGDDPDVNQEWNCDKGRWAFAYASADDRLTGPMIRRPDGTLVEVSWAHALRHAAEGLTAARGRTAVLTGGRLTAEDAYAYSRFARTVLDTNDIDFRARAHSAEETDFLATHIAARPDDVTYRELGVAPAVLLVAFEPEEESPIVFLRMRRAVRTARQQVTAVAALRSAGVAKLNGTLVPTAPGDEPAVLDSDAAADAVAAEGSVIVVGERLAAVPGGLSAAVRLARRTGARLAWIPRRAGERGAVEVGAAPNLLPGGRPVADLSARTELAMAWQIADLPSTPGRDTAAILDATLRQEISALVVGGVELDDLPDPASATAALADADFVVSLEMRRSAVTEYADVVFPVAAAAEKPGMFVDWEGRARPFATALPEVGTISDHRVLDALAKQMGVTLHCDDTTAIRGDLERIGAWRGARTAMPEVEPRSNRPSSGTETRRAVLATWRMLLDAGRMQDGEPHLAGTARAPVARMSPTTAAGIGAGAGTDVEVGTDRGAIILPLEIVPMADGVVWVPMNAPGAGVYTHLRAGAGDVVAIAPAATREVR
ncbi:NADH-quinone oxidoreductase subunit G [Gordonia sp. SL306]|uniref:NADH-quinone oxidoreductase subunit G n=1 Tax=Gordonia sp. SL306 TaxID=2995145 RepID=UPI00226D9A2F|nr:NADH-quinone oxidoreductase subunit G [Gordonia sp. SL306]WAC57881.1 NADH-quinone oxidoreductase subunit G [Gordonia sp. SL306]